MFENTKSKRLRRLEASNKGLYQDRKILSERIAKLHKEYNDLVDAHATQLAEAKPNEAQQAVISWAIQLYQQVADELAIEHGADVAESGRLANIVKELRRGTVTFSFSGPGAFDSILKSAYIDPLRDMVSGKQRVAKVRVIAAHPSRDLRPLLRKRAR